MLEHIIQKRITNIRETINYLSPNERGFCSGLLTITELTELVHDLACAINNHSQIDMIFLDLAKAFHSVCHIKLIAKLETVLGKAAITTWIKDFLIDRSQFVVIENMPSKNVQLTSGVKQGSVLGLVC